jgi:hypothetical protein
MTNNVWVDFFCEMDAIFKMPNASQPSCQVLGTQDADNPAKLLHKGCAT